MSYLLTASRRSAASDEILVARRLQPSRRLIQLSLPSVCPFPAGPMTIIARQPCLSSLRAILLKRACRSVRHRTQLRVCAPPRQTCAPPDLRNAVLSATPLAVASQSLCRPQPAPVSLVRPALMPAPCPTSRTLGADIAARWKYYRFGIIF